MARKNQDKVKDYSSYRLSHADYETVSGKRELVSKSMPDIQGILEDIRRQPVVDRRANKYKKTH